MPEILRACFLALDDFVNLRRTDSRLSHDLGSMLWLVDSIGSLVRCLVCGSRDGKWSGLVEAEWRGGRKQIAALKSNTDRTLRVSCQTLFARYVFDLITCSFCPCDQNSPILTENGTRAHPYPSTDPYPSTGYSCRIATRVTTSRVRKWWPLLLGILPSVCTCTGYGLAILLFETTEKSYPGTIDRWGPTGRWAQPRFDKGNHRIKKRPESEGSLPNNARSHGIFHQAAIPPAHRH
eukprot:3940332-Rhodomonas_salina.1